MSAPRSAFARFARLAPLARVRADLSVARLLGACVIAGACAAPGAARADTGDVVAAEALFRSGKDLLAQKDYAHACPKLAESFRLDPASGTLLALAICHERQGKLASAWGEYSDVASRSKLESRPDRETAARGKVAELQAQVSTLTIAVPDAAVVAGLEVKRAGTVIAPAWFGTPLPVDGGTIAIDVAAPGKKPRHSEVVIAVGGDRQTVTIDPLEDESAPAPNLARPLASPPPSAAFAPTAANSAAAVSTPLPPTPATNSSSDGLGTRQVTGIFVGAVGVASLGLATYFTVHAIDKNNASQSGCTGGDLCTPAGSKDRSDALAAGNIASSLFIGGGVLAAVGTILLLGGHGSREGSTANVRTSLHLVPTGEAHGFGGMLQGNF